MPPLFSPITLEVIVLLLGFFLEPISIMILTLPVLGALERAGLREHAQRWVANRRALTPGRLMTLYLALRQTAAALGLTCPILSDPGKDVARAYGVLGPSGFASRWTFYVGTDGRILDIDTQVRAASHGRDVAARLRELGIS